MRSLHSSPLIVFAAVLLAGAMVVSYPSQFMGTKTGAPSEGTCNCHGTANTGPGQASLSASKTQFAPGDTLTVTMFIKQASQRRWGFEVTVLDSMGMPAGTLIATDLVNTQDTTRPTTNRQYVWHTLTGTRAGTADSNKWQFRWIATPAPTGKVTFYACGLAANNDGSQSGDYDYTATLTVPVAVAVSCCMGKRGNVDGDAMDKCNLVDLSSMINYLTGGAFKPPCMAETDVTADTKVNLVDLSSLINYLTGGAFVLPNCP